MNIAIVDDDVDFSSELQQYVIMFIERLYTRYEIDIINSDFFNNSLDKNYDIVFLDIDLKEINGINIGKKLLVSEANPIIIFVSSRGDLVFSSLSVRPFYFVRKAYLRQDLEEMFILLKTYLKETMQLFTFDFHGRKTNLFLKDIYFIESSRHDVTLYTKNGEYCYRSTMRNILDTLGTETIVQFQKSFSVNLDYIKEIEKNTIILKNNEEFNIGRKFKNNVIQKYKEHFLR